jgi:hypothetical protein
MLKGVAATCCLLQALKPKEGRFLPAAAALGGLLFLAPDGHCVAEHDVLQLQTSLLALKQQQGYVTCQSKPDVSSRQLEVSIAMVLCDACASCKGVAATACVHIMPP